MSISVGRLPVGLSAACAFAASQLGCVSAHPLEGMDTSPATVDAPDEHDAGADASVDLPDAPAPVPERVGHGVARLLNMRVIEAGVRVADSREVHRFNRDGSPPDRLDAFVRSEAVLLDEQWAALFDEVEIGLVTPRIAVGFRGLPFVTEEPCAARAELLEWGQVACVYGPSVSAEEVVVFDLVRGSEIARTSLLGEAAVGQETIPLGPRAFGLVFAGSSGTWGHLQAVLVDDAGNATLAALSTAEDMRTPVTLVGWPVQYAVEATGEVRDLRGCLSTEPSDCAVHTGDDLLPDDERVVTAEGHPTEGELYLLLESRTAQRLVRMAFPSGEITSEVPWGAPSVLPTLLAHDPYSSDVFVARCLDASCAGGWDLDRVPME